MKFSEFKYERPDIKEFETGFNALMGKFNNAGNADEQDAVISEINALRADYSTMREINSINYTVDTTNEFQEREHDYFDDVKPAYEGLMHKFYDAILNSPYKSELEEKRGKHLFDIAGRTIMTYSPEIAEDLKEENHLTTKYVKLMASAKIMFEGEERNLAGLVPFAASTDREMRKKASEAKWKFLSDNEEELDSIYDSLVKVRTRIAKKLGFKNFVELGYARMKRTEYGPAEVAKFRGQVLKHIVPLSMEVKAKQRARLGLEDMNYYDYELQFKNGNPNPKGDPEWIVRHAKDMYKEVSPDTEEFMNHMIDGGLMDLYNKKGKAMGGYCTFISNYKSPFIFANMNGTSDDIRVLTHEAGHAFQCYSSRDYETPEYIFPTLEAAEIHSMSMEYITWPWMKLFFEEDAEKFKVVHLERSVAFIPYGVSVDEFQHYVYENPDATPAERKQEWKRIEKKYMPYRDYSDNDFLNRGGFWQGQAHIFKVPFYYIDYCLAEICAYQFWQKANENREQALEDYIRLCKAGGSKPYLELVRIANLKSPFDDGTVEGAIENVSAWLSQVDESKLL